MTTAGLLALAVIVAAFVFFMGMLAYALIVAGESGEAAKSTATETAGTAAASRQSVRHAVKERGKAGRRKAPALEEAA